MNKKSKVVLISLCFLILISLVVSNYISDSNKKNQFKIYGEKVSSYISTTKERVGAAVITLPDGNTLVGLKNNIGYYATLDGLKGGVVTVQDKFLKTNFIDGIYKKINPRLDAIIPMYVSSDVHGGSTYIVLFNDRGDVALEKSYARLGGPNIKIESIIILPKQEDLKNVEYKVDVHYILEGRSRRNEYESVPKEVIIPVIDGHFDPKGTISI